MENSWVVGVTVTVMAPVELRAYEYHFFVGDLLDAHCCVQDGEGFTVCLVPGKKTGKIAHE